MPDYPDDLQVHRLTTWPGTLTPAHRRTRSPYSASLSSTLALLRAECRALNATRPILEVAMPPEQFRIDGRPRAQAKAEHPGVVLSLPRSTAGPLRFAADAYDTWQGNLRAIALTMQALRAVDRHGAVKAAEQYAGFKALPSGAMPAGAMTVDAAARVLAALVPLDQHGQRPDGGDLLHGPGSADRRSVDRAYRDAARVHHPDAGGYRATWDRLERAKRVLDEHAGGAA